MAAVIEAVSPTNAIGRTFLSEDVVALVHRLQNAKQKTLHIQKAMGVMLNLGLAVHHLREGAVMDLLVMIDQGLPCTRVSYRGLRRQSIN